MVQVRSVMVLKFYLPVQKKTGLHPPNSADGVRSNH